MAVLKQPIDDHISQLETYWDTDVTDKPEIHNEADKINMANKGRVFEGDIIYISAPNGNAKFVDPSRSVYNATYLVNIEIIGTTDGKRDNMLDEVFRLTFSTGLSGYENRRDFNFGVRNIRNKFTAFLNYRLDKYNQKV